MPRSHADAGIARSMELALRSALDFLNLAQSEAAKGSLTLYRQITKHHPNTHPLPFLSRILRMAKTPSLF